MDVQELQEQKDDIRDMMLGGLETSDSQPEGEVPYDQEDGRTASDEGEGKRKDEGQEEKEMTLDERYANLLQEHNRLSAYVLERGEGGAPQERSIQVQQPEVLPPEKAPVRFTLDKDTLRKALIEDNEDALEEVLGGMLNYVSGQMDAQREQIRESILLSIPATARQVAQQELILLGAVKEFYEQNEDLQPYQSIVGAITNEIVAKEPQLTLQQTLEKVEKEVRTRLGLKKRIRQNDLSGGRGKSFDVARPSGSSRPSAPRQDGIREDIAAMQRAKF